MRDRLYLLTAPFEDEGQLWYCNDCATLEGALAVNPEWSGKVDVRRMAYPRPRVELAELLGEENQWLPVLVLDSADAPPEAKRVGDYAILQDPKAIARAIVSRHGGAGPHP